ncbi:hypothetical protein GDO81_003610 [Engystomops pustulosus]|uniref:Uncharacterized protein n=1 Tax=Engystomops pustulosus TaxID=76066 RepID=A0AAV6ZY64_ENGPU|nr:hypothetical protein GDO81_003610 [Engystomops pustulosus]
MPSDCKSIKLRPKQGLSAECQQRVYRVYTWSIWTPYTHCRHSAERPRGHYTESNCGNFTKGHQGKFYSVKWSEYNHIYKAECV